MKPVSTSPELGAVADTARNSTRNFVDLDVTGMTCAACASRIERKLNKLDGVTAAVNYATEKARVQIADPEIELDDLIATIEATGYGARLPVGRVRRDRPGRRPAQAADRRRRAGAAGAAALDDPSSQFDGWQWVALRARHAGRHVGCVAVPSGDGAQPASPPDHDGHADLGRCDRRLPLVAVGVAVHLRRRGRACRCRCRSTSGLVGRHPSHLSRGRLDRGGVHSRRALLRGAGEAPRR